MINQIKETSLRYILTTWKTLLLNDSFFFFFSPRKKLHSQNQQNLYLNYVGHVKRKVRKRKKETWRARSSKLHGSPPTIINTVALCWECNLKKLHHKYMFSATALYGAFRSCTACHKGRLKSTCLNCVSWLTIPVWNWGVIVYLGWRYSLETHSCGKSFSKSIYSSC